MVSVEQMAEARRALAQEDRAIARGGPLFADVGGDAAVSF